MRPALKIAAIATTASLALATAAQADVTDSSFWINEFHYDNASTDVGEFVEVVIPATFSSLSDLAVVLYNGNGGAVYDTDTLDTFVAGATVGDFKIYSFTYPSNGIQNGSPDGIAFVNTATATVYQYISYEGSFQAVGGAAGGLTSTDIGVSEAGTEATGNSLYLTGSGNSYLDFTWTGPLTATPGALNTGQTLTAIPEPASMALLGLSGLVLLRRRRA